MDSNRLKYLYMANKPALDTRLDLLVALMTRISADMGPPFTALVPVPKPKFVL